MISGFVDQKGSKVFHKSREYQKSFLFVNDLLGVVPSRFLFVPVRLVAVVFLTGVLVEGWFLSKKMVKDQ